MIVFCTIQSCSCKALLLLDKKQKPTISWNRVPGATSYLVCIMNDSDLCWHQVVRGTEVACPEEPSLKPEVVYSILVSAMSDVEAANEQEIQEVIDRSRTLGREKQQFFMIRCPVGDPCIINGIQGVWTKDGQQGCFCKPQDGS